LRYLKQEALMILVGSLDDIPLGEAVRVDAEVPIAVFNVDGELFAIDDTCTHQDASLADGWVEGCAVECPLHAACFDLRTGMPSGPPAKLPVRTHEVVIDEGVVYVRVTAAVEAAA
jgi:3-phenylpropionate/trans-cinnamate dioxygenase ferredoxin component